MNNLRGSKVKITRNISQEVLDKQMELKNKYGETFDYWTERAINELYEKFQQEDQELPEIKKSHNSIKFNKKLKFEFTIKKKNRDKDKNTILNIIEAILITAGAFHIAFYEIGNIGGIKTELNFIPFRVMGYEMYHTSDYYYNSVNHYRIAYKKIKAILNNITDSQAERLKKDASIHNMPRSYFKDQLKEMSFTPDQIVVILNNADKSNDNIEFIRNFIKNTDKILLMKIHVENIDIEDIKKELKPLEK